MQTGATMSDEKNETQCSVYLADTEQIEQELYREKFRAKYLKTLRSTVYALVFVAAASVLIATLVLPILQIYGNSMDPTLKEGEIVICVKKQSYTYGEICSFYFNNKILVKRIVACPFDYVDIDEEGNVFVNGALIDEPYVDKKSLGNCDITFPYLVPEGTYFVLGDNREASLDSRSSEIGCIEKDEFVGKLILAVWPLSSMKTIK